MLLPREWDALRAHLPERDRDGDLSAGYAKLLASSDPAVVDAAARAWCDWEDALIAHETGGARSPRFDDPKFRVGFARLVTHYFSHAAWLSEDQLLAGAAGHLAAIFLCRDERDRFTAVRRHCAATSARGRTRKDVESGRLWPRVSRRLHGGHRGIVTANVWARSRSRAASPSGPMPA